MKAGNKIGYLLTFLAALLLIGCGGSAKKTSVKKQGHMDTPAFHTARGDEALMNRDYLKARKSYKRAIALDDQYSPALSGLAVVKANLASAPEISEATKTQTLVEAEDLLEKALDTAGEMKGNRARAHIFSIRVYVALETPKERWHEKAMDNYEEAIELTPNRPSPYFFMARAHAKKLNYPEATALYRKVLEFAGDYEEEANKELKRIQRIQRALPGSQFGAAIANVPEISRADVAALFIAELRLDRLYKDRNKKQDTGYQVPKNQKKMKTDPLQGYPDAIDISGHPVEDAILEIMKLGVKGLEPDPAHKFYPDQKITRAEFALMVQDILVKVTQQPSIETQFIGQPSNFPDVREDVWYYNAVRTVISRDLMSVNNKVTGAFEPFGAVSGADALLTIRNLREILKSYLR